MACDRSKHKSCSIIECTNDHRSLFLLPSSNPQKDQWINFIYSGNAPTQHTKFLYVCAKHFTDDCFHNMGQFRAGHAKRLKLKSGSVPTLFGSPTNLGQISIMREQVNVIQTGEKQMLQTPVKIEVKQEEIQAEITTEQVNVIHTGEQQMLLTQVKIEVKQEEIQEEIKTEQVNMIHTGEQQMLQTSVKQVDSRNPTTMRGEIEVEEQPSDEDDEFIPSKIDGDYGSLLGTLKRRRQLIADEFRFIAEEDMAHEGMSTQEEDLLDEELLQEDLDHGEMEDELEPDPQPGSSTGHSLTGPKSARKRKRSPDSDSYPSYSDIDSQAPKPLPFKPSRPFGIDLGSVCKAVRSTSNTMLREIDFFMLFFTRAVVAEICSFTNRQGWELVLNCPSYSSYQGAWIEVTPDEFYKFLGLLIYMGLSILPDSHRHWGTKSLQGSWARGFMSRNRYKAIFAALHVVDPTTENNQDCLRKLRYLMDHLKQKCQQLFQPNQNLTIDERMVKSKARSGFKQYMKGKPTRWGFKLWVIATSDSGYTLDFNVYTGSRDGHVTDLATKVVESLLQPFKDQGHNVWFDNFYTSPALMVKLLEMGTNACGKCRVNRKLFPAEFKDIKRWERKAARGDMRWCRIEGNILVIQWKDTHAVTCLSNFHNANESTKITRFVKDDGDWTKEVALQPTVISDYNKNMGSVDRSDQMIKSYDVLQKTQKWWKTLFFHLIDIAVINSFVLFKEWQHIHAGPGGERRPVNLTQIDFRENLARQLGGIDIHASFPLHTLKPVAPPSSSFHTVHFPKFEASSKRCWLCYRKSKTENKTKVACCAPECNGKRLCLVRDRNCFQSWHSAECDQFREEA
ncbi:piggyBac transposable element-derived protein 4-like isoform X2 [Xyrauchen texanus]|uniref:piggyBac transposable element-derived protein 4-like isoform X2 n=1 Tax=Xyrauchen texanus TaxID=154827 RepID=UPI002241CE2A|nr:piggyBac transposable element-derived protein 4-like isoform X2 [Xyrauchen texanus]